MPVPRAVGRVHGAVMLAEALSLVAAAGLHLSVGLRLSLGPLVVHGEHAPGAAIVELGIAVVLLLGVIAVFGDAVHARLLAAFVTGIAIVGVIARLATIAGGLSPQTVPDLAYQITIMVALLISFGVLMNRHRRS